jgi:hypothetical protein
MYAQLLSPYHPADSLKIDGGTPPSHSQKVSTTMNREHSIQLPFTTAVIAPPQDAAATFRPLATRPCALVTARNTSRRPKPTSPPISATNSSPNPQRAANLNALLGWLAILVVQSRISPRRAAVLAYVSSLLLRSLPEIDRENDTQRFPPKLPAPADQSAAAPPTANVAANDQCAAREPTECSEMPSELSDPTSTQGGNRRSPTRWLTFSNRKARLRPAYTDCRSVSGAGYPSIRSMATI